MNTPHPTRHDPNIVVDLSVSRYDRVCGGLVALLTVVGSAVIVMLLIWLTSVLVFQPEQIKTRYWLEPGLGNHAQGYERDADPPGAEELAEIVELPSDQFISLVSSVVSSQAVSLDDLIDSTARTRGNKRGDSRPPGPPSESNDIIPRWQR